MAFNNPWGLLALLLIIPIILLYILKKQHEDRVISSTMLWQQVLRDLQATRPWQRLRTRLLLILQILAVFLFSMSLARPTLQGSGGGIHYVAVVDTSARMQATDVKPSRMEAARTALLDLIQNMRVRDTMTIVQADRQPVVLAGPSSDKNVLKQISNKIQPSNGVSNLSSAVQLAQTLLQDQSGNSGQIHIYSDHAPADTINHGNLLYHIVSGNGQNAAITHVGYEIKDGSITVLSRVANYGDQRNVTLELRADGVLQNIKEVSLPAGEEVPVYWSDIPGTAREISVTISAKDDLLLDNTGLAAINKDYQVKALLITQRNVFLERAISLRSDIELLKANPEDIPETTGFQLYIYDGVLPEVLPEDGHLIAFAPASKEEIGLTVEGEIIPQDASINNETLYPDLLQYIKPEGYQIAKAVKMNVPEGFTVLLQDKSNNPLLIAGEHKGQKMALFSFSLHESNLPLKADFPILIQNLLNWLVPPDISLAGQVFAGETLPLYSFPGVSRINVTTPAGKEYSFDAYPMPVLYDTNEIGIYEISQQADNKTYTGRFAVSVPTHVISDLRANNVSIPNGSGADLPLAASPFRRDIWAIAGWALLLLLLIEWWVYHHGI
ncbi:MAG TPA: VWA domain-containing protein [Clostridiales bacterium]|nr:VWA domain-containing protein [Clostridiales bacterium]